MQIFVKEKINIGRQKEVDLLRGFTALIMVICHVGLYLGSSSNTALYTFSDIIGSEFAAPIFMAIMGISIVYSRRNQPINLLKRGVFLFVLGYILNFFRSLLPMLILGNINEWTNVEAFFAVDILQLAGLTFMFMALFRKLKLPSFVVLLISIAMVIIDQFIMLPTSIAWDSKVLTGIVNLFCPVSSWSCFPLLTWFFFPAFGLFFGDLLVRCTNKKVLYLIFMVVGLAGVLYVYGTFHFLYPDYTSYYYGHNFYYMGIKNVLLTCCFVFFGLSFWFFVQNILPNFINRFLTFLSYNLNAYYIISWLIISLLIQTQSVIGFSLNTLATIAMMIAVIALSAIVAYGYVKLKGSIKKHREKNNG